MLNFLKRYSEPIPKWLKSHIPGEPVNMADVFESRILFYPGSGTDGQPIKTFNTAHTAHVFCYVDYEYTKEQLISNINKHGFNGYHLIDRINLPKPNHNYITMQEEYCNKNAIPYCFMDIYERNDDKDDTHGAKRFAVLFIFADGFKVYEHLFCNHLNRAPFIAILQDHGFGGNYNCFGAGGILEETAKSAATMPEFILVGNGTDTWDGYTKIPGIEPVIGGMHSNTRFLYQKNKS